MRTSDNAKELGLYASACCGEERIFAEQDCFTRCPRCEHLCEWELVDVLLSLDELERISEEQAA